MEVEIVNDAGAGALPPAPTDERVATVTAVDPSALTPSAMRGLRDIGSQVYRIFQQLFVLLSFSELEIKFSF